MNSEHSRRGVVISIVVALIVVSIAMASAHVFIPRLYGIPSGPGVYGDMYGAVNALFSGLALGGVVLAIVFQSKELSLQRMELEATRTELSGQREQLVLQQETMKKQQFESTFFHHLELFNNIIRSMEFSLGSGHKLTGRDCFSVLQERVEVEVRLAHSKHKGAAILETAKAGYSEFYIAFDSKIGHYYRTLYNTVQYVHQNDIEDKDTYIGLVRSQLSRGELELLFLDCLCAPGDKFKPLVEKYGLLKHLAPKFMEFDEMQTEELKKEFAESAFQ